MIVVGPLQTRNVAINDGDALLPVKLFQIVGQSETVAQLGEGVLITQIQQLIQQLSPPETCDEEGRRDLEHIVGVFQIRRRRIVHAAEANGLSLVVQGDDHNRMDTLPLEVFILQRVGFLGFLQVGDDNILALLKDAVPVWRRPPAVHFCRFSFSGWMPGAHHFVGVVVAAVFRFPRKCRSAHR